MNLEARDNRIDLWSRTLAEWNDVHPASFAVSDSQLRGNLRQQRLVAYSAADLAGIPIVFGVATDEGVRAGLFANTLWLSLWGRVPAGREIEFVSAVEDVARARGKSRVMFGADEFHLTSGVPMPSSQALIAALEAAGYTGGEVADYVGDLASNETSDYIANAHRNADGRGLKFTSVETESDKASLEAFLVSEFPGRWTREFQFWKSSAETARAFWMRLEDSTGIVGFARMAVRGRVRPFEQGWTPGALRLPLSTERDFVFASDDSCLGPIGMAASQRGNGAGKILLGLVLETLRANGATRVCIDWTNAFKYYEPLNYQRVRRIWTAWKDL